MQSECCRGDEDESVTRGGNSPEQWVNMRACVETAIQLFTTQHIHTPIMFTHSTSRLVIKQQISYQTDQLSNNTLVIKQQVSYLTAE